MESCDPVSTPMKIKDKLDLDQNGTPADAMKYQSMIGALMYLTSSRPDIVHATSLCARYQAKPTEKHLKAQFLGEKLVSWFSKKQDCTALSTTEAEYVSLSACCAQVLWMRTQLTDYGFHFNKILIYCDSKSAIAISCNLVQHSRTKHIAARYHFIKEHVEKGTTELYFVKTDYQLADLFTKALPAYRFNYLVRRLGMRILSSQELDRLAKSHQSRRDLPMNTALDRVEVLGWTWIFRNNKNPKSKIIDNPYNKDLERFATSFYVSNLPDLLDAKGLWKACLPYGRLVDAFIANKRSKGAVAIFQRGNFFASQHVHRPPVKDTNPKTEPNPKNDLNPNFPYHQPHETKPSFADITLNKQSPFIPTLYKDTACSINLTENDLITIEDSSIVLLLKLNEADTMSNMYSICKSEGFMDLSIHHVGASDVSSQMKANHLDKDDISIEDKENDDLDVIDGILKGLDNDAKNEENVFVSPKEAVPDQPIKQVEEVILKQPKEECIKVSESSDLSHPPGFENTKNTLSNNIKCSTNFARHHKKDIKEYAAKSSLWNRLAEFMNQHNGKFILFGDFNTVLYEYERSCSLFSRIKAGHFNAFIDSTGLIDLPIGGRHFMWMNKTGTKLSKLDRFLISEGVMEDIPDIKVMAIERLWSDHSPVLLYGKKADFGPSSFKLYNSWLSRDGFDDIVKSMWDSMKTGNGSNKISSHVKLRKLKNASKKWQVDVRKIDRSQKCANLYEIHDIEKIIDDGSASISDREKRIKLLQDIDKLENLEALDLIQKSRIKWDIENDENSKFFHGIITAKGGHKLLQSHISLDEVKNVVWECGSNKAPDPNGGLQIGSLKAFNLALLQKWRWRLLSSPNNMWVNIIKALHGQEGGLNNQGCCFNGTWSRIISTSSFLHSKGIIPLNSFCFKVGCGTSVRFWKDIWIGDSPLHTRSDIGTRNTPYLNDLLLEISQIDISVDEDTCTWVLSNDGTFSIKSARRLIDSKLLPSIPTPTVWDKFHPRKVNIFLWRLSLDRLPRRLNLSSRGLDIPTISCSSYNGNVESAYHVFFEFDLVKEIWCLVRKWYDISIPTFASYDTWYSWFSTWQATKVKSRRLYIICAALFWWIWRYRNSVTFSSDSIKKGDLFDNIRASSFSWISNRGHVPCNWVERLKNPLLIAGS
nr:RNA-directed DNA polymerase, eukaryota, reverse transcriptase zinc-binding domain protein [Tanacetum cinerariifolium]